MLTIEASGTAIEKGFHSGGTVIRNPGDHLESLAIVESINPETGEILFREQTYPLYQIFTAGQPK